MPSDLRPVLVCCAVLLAGCTSAEDEGRFSRESAQDLAQKFQQALAKGDVPALVRLSRTPFRYKDAKRVWPDAATLQTNLAKEVPRIRHLVAVHDRVEAYSRRDLMDGKWPRDRRVPDDRRESEVAALGIEENGWLVRVYSEGRPGYLLVLNPEGLDRLAVQMIEI